MINLLPDMAKKELTLEDAQKKILLIAFFVLISLCIFIISLYGLRLFLHFEIGVAEEMIEQKNSEFEDAQFQEFKQMILNVNQRISNVRAFWRNQIGITQVVEILAKVTNEMSIKDSIYFTNLSFQKMASDQADLNIAGIALTRQALFDFKEDLEKQQILKDIYFTPSSWVEPIDAPFTLHLQFFTGKETINP